MKGQPLATTALYGLPHHTESTNPMIPKDLLARIIADQRLSHGAFRTWIILADRANACGQVTIMQVDLAALIGLTDRKALRRYLDELKSRKALTWESHDRFAGITYQLVDPTWSRGQ